jgi:hypothetical protein
MGAYAQIGQALVQRGYAAIPIIPGSKTPGFLRGRTWVKLTGWSQKFSNGLPTKREQELWSAGDTGVGVVAGPPSNSLVAVDIDTDDDAIRAALRGVLPSTPVRKRGAKGETLFYHGPTVSESKSWNVNNRRVVDLIGPGRQTVLPPSIHPTTGTPYVWLSEESLESWAPSQLPVLTLDVIQRITQALVPFGYEVPEAIAAAETDTPHRQLNEAALARLEMWVPGLRL